MPIWQINNGNSPANFSMTLRDVDFVPIKTATNSKNFLLVLYVVEARIVSCHFLKSILNRLGYTDKCQRFKFQSTYLNELVIVVLNCVKLLYDTHRSVHEKRMV